MGPAGRIGRICNTDRGGWFLFGQQICFQFFQMRGVGYFICLVHFGFGRFGSFQVDFRVRQQKYTDSRRSLPCFFALQPQCGKALRQWFAQSQALKDVQSAQLGVLCVDGFRQQMNQVQRQNRAPQRRGGMEWTEAGQNLSRARAPRSRKELFRIWNCDRCAQLLMKDCCNFFRCGGFQSLCFFLVCKKALCASCRKCMARFCSCSSSPMNCGSAP